MHLLHVTLGKPFPGAFSKLSNGLSTPEVCSGGWGRWRVAEDTAL